MIGVKKRPNKQRQLFFFFSSLTRIKAWLWGVGLGCLSIGFGVIIMVHKEQWLKVKKIDCLQDNHLCSAETLAVLNTLQDTSLLKLDKEYLKRELLHNNVSVRQVDIWKQLPNTLKVHFVSRTPVANIQDKKGNQFLVDEDNKVFLVPFDEPLPTIVIPESLYIGQELVNPIVLRALELRRFLVASQIAFTLMMVEGEDTLLLQLNSQQTALFSGKKDLASQVDALQYILSHSRSQQETLLQVDLRFDNPILRR